MKTRMSALLATALPRRATRTVVVISSRCDGEHPLIAVMVMSPQCLPRAMLPLSNAAGADYRHNKGPPERGE